MIDKIASYLAKLGYIAEEVGDVIRFVVILKENMPIGFIMPDLSVSVVADDYRDELIAVIDFVKNNENLDVVGQSEYLLATYKNNQLTTFLDGKEQKYAVYIVDDIGEVKTEIFLSEEEAKYNFLVMSNMIKTDDVKKQGLSVKNKVINKAVSYLLSKKTS